MLTVPAKKEKATGLHSMSCVMCWFFRGKKEMQGKVLNGKQNWPFYYWFLGSLKLEMIFQRDFEPTTIRGWSDAFIPVCILVYWLQHTVLRHFALNFLFVESEEGKMARFCMYWELCSNLEQSASSSSFSSSLSSRPRRGRWWWR